MRATNRLSRPFPDYRLHRIHYCPDCRGRTTPLASISAVIPHFRLNFHSPEYIESGLPEPGIQIVFHNRCKPCPLGLVMKMADSKILFDDVAHLGDLFVTFDFPFRKFGSGRVFTHDAIGDFVV